MSENNREKISLLIITQKVEINDQILGFFHRWIEEFSKECKEIKVICLEKGEYSLPNNVEVFSLGKEDGKSKIHYLTNFYKYIWRERKKYNAVFVHMNPEYMILGGMLWRALGKKTSLWYVHKSVDMKLKVAEKFSRIIFSASPESFRLNTKKLRVVGHGIDVEKFKSIVPINHNQYTILSVARISETKNQLVMVMAFSLLKQKGFSGKMVVVGSPVTVSDKIYYEKIIEYVENNNLQTEILFKGSLEPYRVIDVYRESDLFINLSTTGSLDKAVLEAMACGLQIVTSNEAFKTIVPEKNQCSLLASEIAEKILTLSREKADPALREYVIEKNNIKNLIPVICNIIKEQ